jgi:hypothetical protein
MGHISRYEFLFLAASHPDTLYLPSEYCSGPKFRLCLSVLWIVGYIGSSVKLLTLSLRKNSAVKFSYVQK